MASHEHHISPPRIRKGLKQRMRKHQAKMPRKMGIKRLRFRAMPDMVPGTMA